MAKRMDISFVGRTARLFNCSNDWLDVVKNVPHFQYKPGVLYLFRHIEVHRRAYTVHQTMVAIPMAKLTEDNIDGVTVLRISGSLTVTGMSEFEQRFNALASQKAVRAIVDMSAVDALTTPAITIMLRTARAVEQSGGKLVFANPRPAIARMFACCRLDLVLPFAADVNSALRTVRSVATDPAWR
jgi:anti-anti-sigma factor